MGTTAAAQPRWSTGPLAKALGAIALIILTAITTYAVTARLNVETALQQQNAAALQEFEKSGGQMDVALSVYVDTLLDRGDTKAARNDVRTAITMHTSQTNALRSLVGSGNVDQYIDGLGDLRQFADDVNGRLTAKKMAQQHVNLMDYRVKMVSMARQNIYK